MSSMPSSTAFTKTGSITSSNVNKIQWGTPSGSSGTATNSSFIGASPGSFTGSSYASGAYPYGTTIYGANVYGSGYGDASRVALKALLASAFLQYTTTAIAMPWEVGKVLLQVQWVPQSLDSQLDEPEEDEYDDNDELVGHVFIFNILCRRYQVLISIEPICRVIHQQTIHIS